MDMLKIERKLKNHRYRSAEDFDADVELMVRNCRTFNGSEHEYTKLGVKLLSIWKAFSKSAGVGAAAAPHTAAGVAQPVRAPAAAFVMQPVLGLADLTPAMQGSVQRMQDLTDTGEDGVLLSEVLAAALDFLAGADSKGIFTKPVCFL
jgi:hypothetical protein